jgi:hypothetical protein
VSRHCLNGTHKECLIIHTAGHCRQKHTWKNVFIRTCSAKLKVIITVLSWSAFLRQSWSSQQCFGSGSGWIRIQFGPGSGIWIRIRNPDSGSICIKIGLKSQNLLFTWRKMLWLSWNFNYSFLSLFQELTTHGNFLLSRTVKKLSHRMEIFCWLCNYITMSQYKSTKTRRKNDFLPVKN